MTDLIESLVRGLGLGGLYAVLGVSFVIVYRATGVINFATPALMILGAFFTGSFGNAIGLPFWLSVLLGMAVMAIIGMVIERIALRPMVGRPAFSAATVTVGVFIILLIVAGRLIGSELLTVNDPFGLNTVDVLGARLFTVDIARLVIALVAIGIVGLFLTRSRTGLAMRATAFDQETSLAQGINVGRMFGLSWGIAAAMAALAGALLTAGSSGVETTVALVALKALPVIILGGLDSIKGSVIAGLIIGIAESLTRTYQPIYAPWLGANFDVIVPYLIMIIVLMVRPYGLYGTKEVVRV
ncbi:MAG: branched-chain amino acid ABC transporter permease [Actinobacteria bacterium]|nr:branched-chain amino acid ABC transporter permease [Actinomycetota bacterium]